MHNQKGESESGGENGRGIQVFTAFEFARSTRRYRSRPRVHTARTRVRPHKTENKGETRMSKFPKREIVGRRIRAAEKKW